MPDRYRLFFRYQSHDVKNSDDHSGKVVVIWMNDEFTLRNKGGKNDVYAIFIKMINSKKFPSNWKALLNKTKALPRKFSRL
jgi:toxin YhaV